MVTNFVVVVTDVMEEDGNSGKPVVGVTGVHPFPSLSGAKKKADKIKADQNPYDIVVWDLSAGSEAYSPYP